MKGSHGQNISDSWQKQAKWKYLKFYKSTVLE